MGHIHVDRNTLLKASRRHWSLVQEFASDSHILLALYAIECGMNAVLLSQRKIHTTSHLDAEDIFGHNLARLAQAVGSQVVFISYKTVIPANKRVVPNDYHSLFRYGGKLELVDREDLTKKIKMTYDWIQENLV